MLIFTEETIRQHVKLGHPVINEIESAFIDLATKEVQMPEVLRVDIASQNGEMDVKTAYIPGYDMFALKVSTGFFNNVNLGLPSTGGLMMLINATNGQPEAILHDNGYLTDIRTAAAGAVAARKMANDQVETVGVIGAGAQARYQLEALQYVKDYKQVRVFSRSKKRLENFKSEMEQKLDVPVTIEKDAELAVRNSDLLITTTPASEPVVHHDWISPGMHITAMGSDAQHKQELTAGVMQQANVIVCDVINQCEILGELRSALQSDAFSDHQKVRELGNVLLEKKPVREKYTDITVADLTGTGAQDTKIALFAYHRLMEQT